MFLSLFQKPRLAIFLLLFLSYVLITRQHASAVDTVTTTPVASYMLMTLNGFGGGKHPAGSTVHIWANPPEPGMTFDGWSGDIQVLPNARSTYLSFTMPAQDVRIQASYKPLSWHVSFTRMFGRDTYSYFPPGDARGLILFFHGSGSDAKEWFDFTERKQFLDEAVAEGYALIAFDSSDRVSKQWDLSVPPQANTDLDVVRAILMAFRDSGQIASQLPLYAAGMSRGGRFASLVAYALGMKATAIWVGLGHEEIMTVTNIPTLWCLGARDPIIDRETAFLQYQQLSARQVDTVFYVHAPHPVYPQNFVGVEGIDRAASQQLFAELQSQGYLDENHFLLENPRISRWETHVGLKFSEAARLEIRDRLFVAFAEHTFYDDCGRRALDFLEAHP